MMKWHLATAPGFANYFDGLVTEETDILTGDQVIVRWSGVSAIRLPNQPPPDLRLGQNPHHYP
jgi:hypothetical protein